MWVLLRFSQFSLKCSLWLFYGSSHCLFWCLFYLRCIFCVVLLEIHSFQLFNVRWDVWKADEKGPQHLQYTTQSHNVPIKWMGQETRVVRNVGFQHAGGLDKHTALTFILATGLVLSHNGLSETTTTFQKTVRRLTKCNGVSSKTTNCSFKTSIIWNVAAG